MPAVQPTPGAGREAGLALELRGEILRGREAEQLRDVSDTRIRRRQVLLRRRHATGDEERVRRNARPLLEEVVELRRGHRHSAGHVVDCPVARGELAHLGHKRLQHVVALCGPIRVRRVDQQHEKMQCGLAQEETPWRALVLCVVDMPQAAEGAPDFRPARKADGQRAQTACQPTRLGRREAREGLSCAWDPEPQPVHREVLRVLSQEVRHLRLGHEHIAYAERHDLTL